MPISRDSGRLALDRIGDCRGRFQREGMGGMINIQDDFLNPKETAEILGIHVQTLAMWRTYKEKLPYITVGRFIRYKRKDVEFWRDNGLVGPKLGNAENRRLNMRKYRKSS